MAKEGARHLVSNIGGVLPKHEVLKSTEEYEKYHAMHGGDKEARKSNYTDMVNKYYDLVNSFYEYGWGESYHFANRWRGETLRESIKRHEHFLALHLHLKPGMKVLDVGCGIGGPARGIAAFSGASVTGLNNNDTQIARGKVLTEKAGLSHLVDYMKADFMKIPVADNTYDAVYTIEASCHAPDPVACYSEIRRVLKPGQLFAGYEWCITDAYNPGNKDHKRIKEEIELGNGLPDIRSTRQVLQALKDAGFEILMEEDLAKHSQVPWYQPLDPNHFSLSTLRLTPIGRFFTHNMVRVLEALKIAPEGSARVSTFLEQGMFGLVDGGRMEVFTPMYYFLVRKPLESS
ncbi:cycloartenol-C-24-methyltransferase 1 [Physcomitrium patens]|uniref:Methyltransferase n=1 Tax=Physcomitrium patens TaxID=3218 RepID=A0A2K1JH83_PHYPA|nr:cycloartenol-C-24-methyltransferase 1-like [Physcomitrium patens]XP_024395495.1 cycloartenol-C-24-methyltransferase 1-like [Physcomitrium patens]PNR40912.1 hypothetical protein PHYPA_018315 [Physcomitrium patens]|eukprot:XP_024395494.1 cycloartenol-C-24-methyltransferase 1-like [Physcomitrella patens]